ncbi:MAG: hypothetical protein J5I90_18100 [Caldilineales bacterium]|nr:hypothetical protein [Caldilineales bacterium]
MTLLVAALGWLLALALIANILRRRSWLPGLLVAAGLAFLALQLWRMPIMGNAELFGRTLDLAQSSYFFGLTMQLDASARAAFLILLWWGAIFALAAAWTNADRALVPAIPLILSALLLVLCTQSPLLWAPMWLALAAVVITFPAQGAGPRLARGALRTLLAPVLALPLFLFASWVLNQSNLAIDDPQLWTTAWRVLVIALAILLTPVPLHGWIVALGEHAPPFAAAFAVGVWQLTVYTFMRRVLFAYPTVVEFADPAVLLPWVAVIQMAWAALFGLSSNRLSQLWGYLLLFDFGAAFLLWGVTGEFGVQSMLWLFLARPLVLLLVAAGLRTLNARYGENVSYDRIHGAARRLPFASIGVVAGGLFLLGWPLGALFPARFSAYLLTESSENRIFIIVLVALLLASLAMIRALRAVAQPLADPQLLREPRRLGWLITPLIIIGLLVFLNPGIFEPITSRLAFWMSTI